MNQSHNDQKRPSGAGSHVVIVGGGIAGLSAAWQLQQEAAVPLRVTVLEKEDRWGGKILTQRLPAPNGGTFVIDAGPESFVTRKPALWQLTSELGLRNAAQPLGSEAGGTYVLDDGTPQPLPLGPLAFVRSPLLSWRGKLRMLAEPFISARTDDEDESLADFVTRRLGREALEKFIGPVLGGIYNTNPETQSILVTSPIMRQMEKESGSLVRAALRRVLQRKEQAADAPPARFIGFTAGADVMVDALVAQLDADLRLQTGVVGIETTAGGYVVVSEQGERFAADVVILATTANVSATLLAPAAPEAAALLRAMDHNHIGTASLAFRAADFQPQPPARGLMIPRRERRRIDAVTWTSAKNPLRAPQGYELVRVFFGGGDPAVMDLEDGDLLAVIRQELAALLGVTAEPVTAAFARWPNGYPQAAVGHLQRVAAAAAALPEGLWLTGSSYYGLAVPDCIEHGRACARQALAALTGVHRPVIAG